MSLRHHCDLRALSRLARRGTNLYRAVVDFRYFRLEQILDQFRRRTRDDHLRSLRRFLDSHDYHANALTRCERLQSRLLFFRHPRLGLAQVEDVVLAFHALHRGVHDFAYAIDVLAVDRVTLGFTHLLEDDLFR